MGTLVSITLYAESAEQAQGAFLAAFTRIGALNTILSDYNPDSELSRVCASNTPLSPELATILSHAQRLAQQTEGAFDITSKPVIALWRQARAQGRLPSPEQIRSALGRSGFRKLRLSRDGSRVHCLAEGMQLDAGGIAKGYAADEALRVLAKAGIRSALVAISGDIVVSGAPPGRDGWRVRVQDRVLSLVNAAVSTSGDEFQHIEIGGIRYSHIIDPRSGMALRNSRTISVLAATGIEADGLATALSVTPPDQLPSMRGVTRPGERIVDARRPLLDH